MYDPGFIPIFNGFPSKNMKFYTHKQQNFLKKIKPNNYLLKLSNITLSPLATESYPSASAPGIDYIR